MLLSGFTFIRNALKYDFPIRECIESMLPVVDELVINVGKSEDGTEELIARLASESPKIRIVNSVWDDAKIERGLVLSEQTNIALDACRGRWALYLQADEAIHEEEHAAIRAAVEAADLEGEAIDGLRFRYLHFYGGYTLVQRAWNWYPSEIRALRRASGARSYGDAQTFRLAGDAELRTRLLETHVFHYGHARAPDAMARKISYFHRFWHGDEHGIRVDDPYNFQFKNLVWYWGTHPRVYKERVASGRDWSPRPEQIRQKRSYSSVCILSDASSSRLASELRELLESIEPGLHVVENPAQPLAGASALVDLLAESRGQLASLLMGSWLRRSGPFAWKVAHAPEGKLSAIRARKYDAVSWGCHETEAQGFRVPDQERAKQLCRCLGIDPAASDRKR